MLNFRKLTALFILIALFWELLDPSTTFVRIQIDSNSKVGATTSAKYAARTSADFHHSSDFESDSSLQLEAQSHYSTGASRFKISHPRPVLTKAFWSLILESPDTKVDISYIDILHKRPTPDFILIYQMSDA